MQAPSIKNKKSFVLAMIVRPTGVSDDPEFLVIDVVSTDLKTGKKHPLQIKFPGGTERLEDEPIEVMLPREVLEETYLMVNSEKALKVWEKRVSPDHTKYGYLINIADCHGTLRTEQINDEDAETNDDMSPPRWERASVLKHTLFGGHQPALTQALMYLCFNPIKG